VKRILDLPCSRRDRVGTVASDSVTVASVITAAGAAAF
jgi:hypothetical protein